MITLGPIQIGWLKSIVTHGPTAHATDGAAAALIHKGLARRESDGKLGASDLGREVILAREGKRSTMCVVR